jgi:hypothetical protein
MPYASSGPARVVASGTVTTYAGFPLIFGIVDPRPVEVELRFASDPGVPDVAVRPLPGEGARITWELVYFDGPDGRGTADPVLLNQAPESSIYLHFRVFRYGRTADRTVHYTFFEVAAAAVQG